VVPRHHAGRGSGHRFHSTAEALGPRVASVDVHFPGVGHAEQPSEHPGFEDIELPVRDRRIDLGGKDLDRDPVPELLQPIEQTLPLGPSEELGIADSEGAQFLQPASLGQEPSDDQRSQHAAPPGLVDTEDPRGHETTQDGPAYLGSVVECRLSETINPHFFGGRPVSLDGLSVPFSTAFDQDRPIDADQTARCTGPSRVAPVTHISARGTSGEFPIMAAPERRVRPEACIEGPGARTDSRLVCRTPNTSPRAPEVEPAEGTGASTDAVAPRCCPRSAISSTQLHDRALCGAVEVPGPGRSLPVPVACARSLALIDGLAGTKISAGFTNLSGTSEWVRPFHKGAPGGYPVNSDEAVPVAPDIVARGFPTAQGSANVVHELAVDLAVPAWRRTANTFRPVEELLHAPCVAIGARPVPSAVRYLRRRRARVRLEDPEPRAPLAAQPFGEIDAALARAGPMLRSFE
jgi:dihydrodipicolinate synthase/N-acetylneuraminate lyase